MSEQEQLRQVLRDVVRVYRLYGRGCARARLVYHGYRIEDERLERMLSVVAELAELGRSTSTRTYTSRRAA